MPSATIHFLRYYSRRLVFWFAVSATVAAAAERKSYTLEGELRPAPRFSFSNIAAVGSTYNNSAPVYWDGKFKYKNLPPGQYAVIIYVPRMGEFRQTYSVGPATSDKKGRVKINIVIHPSRAARLFTPKDRFTIPVRRLSIPDKARREFADAHKKLRKNDFDGAEEHLNKATELAPQYAAAWNALGTIYYQRGKFTQAEEYFREAIRQDPDLFEPVVNLGGALLSQNRPKDAVTVNQDAVKRRPKDALANSQLGLSFLESGNPEMAERYLQEAKRLDPGHYSNPQIYLSQIYFKRGQRQAAAAELEHFLRHHPDSKDAGQIRAAIKKFRGE
ncbi:MAG: tetratricopeptide repeat protein [Acidobacteria bacterium]|nr:tetratricopeptide repeat protein [Acidobacteriota bacterium]